MSWWSKLRRRLGSWLLGSKDPRVLHQRRKLEIYEALGGTTIRDTLGILSEIILEVTAGDINITKVQASAPGIAEIEAGMQSPDFIYLLASGINHKTQQSLTPEGDK